MKRIGELLAGPPGYIIGGIIFLAYGVSALAPFRWSPPKSVQNGAQLTDDGTIRFSTAGLSVAPATADWLKLAIRRNEFRIHVRARPFFAHQSGPARILSLSAGTGRNVAIGQDAADLIVTMRGPESPVSGHLQYRIPAVFGTLEWRDMSLALIRGVVTLVLDGQIVLSDQLSNDALKYWNPNFSIVLGNELSGKQPWLGEISHAEVMVDERVTDFLGSGTLTIPSHYWSGVKMQLFSEIRYGYPRRDLALNFLCFIPLGFILAMIGGELGSFTHAVAYCGMASLCVEMAQVCFDSRFPSSVDLVSNISGAILGAWTARHLVTRLSCETSHPRLDVAQS